MKNSVKKILLVSASAISSLISVILFYKAGLGINFPLFTLFLTVIVVVLGLVFKRASFSLCLNCLMLFLISVPLFITTSEPIRFVLVAVWLYLMTLIVQTLAIPNEKFEFWRYLITPVEQFVMGFISPILVILKKRNIKLPYVKFLRVLLGVIIALPILAIFLALLVSADLALRQLVTDVFSVDFIWDVVKITVWFCLVFWFGFGLFYYNILRKEKYEPKNVKLDASKSRFFIEGVTILSLVEFLFLIFNIIQLTYLFGGESMISGDTFTYSEYARKGFFELVAVSFFALILIAGVYKLVKASSQMKGIVIRLVSIFGILLLIPMTTSAFYRLYMYEQAYGFTRLRAYSHLFIIFLIIIFVWFLVKFFTRLKETNFLYGIELISLISLIVVGFINVDATIAKLNINRYISGVGEDEELDLAYLNTLSLDTIMTLVRYFEEGEEEQKEEVAFYLKSKYDRIIWDEKDKDFREFNLREYTAKKILEGKIDEIERYSTIYEGKAIEKYPNERYIDYAYVDNDSYDSCDYVQIKDIDKNGNDNYAYSSIEFYNADNLQEKLGGDLGMCGYDSGLDECCDLGKGEYYIVLRNYFMFIEEVKEVFKVDVEKEDEEIFLVSREEAYSDIYR